jgi:hypothetical protein
VGGAMGRFGFIILLILQTAISANSYKTYYPWESDSVLVAWVIDKFADTNASFIAVDKRKEKIGKKNSINSSNSKLRRTARFTAFEMALHHYKVDNSCTNKIKRVIRVLEMTPWKKNEYEDVLAFEEGFVTLFPTTIEDNNLTKAFLYIDKFCKGKR